MQTLQQVKDDIRASYKAGMSSYHCFPLLTQEAGTETQKRMFIDSHIDYIAKTVLAIKEDITPIPAEKQADSVSYYEFATMLPKKYASLFLNNVISRYLSEGSELFSRKKPCSIMLSSSFEWKYTQEGYGFWYNVELQLFNNNK